MGLIRLRLRRLPGRDYHTNPLLGGVSSVSFAGLAGRKDGHYNSEGAPRARKGVAE